MVLLMMIDHKLIPLNGRFDISEEQLSQYIEYYSQLHGRGNGKVDRKYARKLAGLNLLKYKFSMGEKFSTCKEGLIYFVENPSYPDHLKVGMTIDLDTRLATYQTYDPFRKFKVKHYEFVLNRRLTEDKILNSFNVDIENGEWIKKTDAIALLEKCSI